MVMVFGNRYPCFAVQDGQDMTWVHSMSTCRVQDHVLSMYSSICSANTRLWIPIMILSICSKSEESRVSQGEPGWVRAEPKIHSEYILVSICSPEYMLMDSPTLWIRKWAYARKLEHMLTGSPWLVFYEWPLFWDSFSAISEKYLFYSELSQLLLSSMNLNSRKMYYLIIL